VYGEVEAAGLVAAPALQSSGLFAPPGDEPCRHFQRLPWRITDVPLPVERAAPCFGADSRAVLAEAGVDAATIDHLIDAGVVADRGGQT
jgi:crotonobetainyl-CoA:carnitine CoA-transferase CaiB-like acyl-CoA transferase